MAGEVELERLVVRLIGDGSSFQKMMTDAVATTRTMTNRMYTAISRAERFAGTLIKGLGSFGLASSLRGMFGQFADLEQGQIRLNAAIRGGGHDADVLVRQYTRVAESLASMTLNTKGQILGLFQQAEANQLSGQAAEDAVKYAIALAGATGQSADAMMRTAIQLVRGHPEFAKRVLNLRDVKNGTELLTKIQEKMNTGMAIASAEFNSANGRMERLGRAFKGMGQDIGGMIAKVLLPIVGVVQQVFDAFKKLEPETKKQIALILGLAVAWLGMGPVTQVLRDLLTPTIHLIRFIAIEIPLMVIRTTVWLAWKTALLAAGLAITVISAVALLCNFNLAGMKVLALSVAAAFGVQSAAISIATVVMSLWNGAVAASTLVAAGVGIIAVATAFTAVYSAISSVVAIFRNLPSMSAPLSQVTRILGEWWTMLKEVFNVAQNDLPKAWQLLKAGFDVAMSQMRDAWTPMWDFLRQGFTAIWTAISALFVEKMTDAMYAAPRALRRFVLGEAGAQLLEGGRANREREERERNILGTMNISLSNLSRNFNVVESDATRASRAAYNALKPVGAAATDGALRLRLLRDAMKDVRQEAQRFDAALHGSVEALARIAEYKDRIAVGRVNPSPVLNAAAVGQLSAASASVTGLGGNAALPVLNSILLAIQNATILRVQPAALGNP